jgi:hypothetical protein
MGGWRFQPVSADEPLFLYRRHEKGSLSTKSPVALWDGVVRNAALVEGWAQADGGLDASLKEGIIRCYFQAARNFAGNDWTRFNAVVARLEKLGAPLIPEGPPHLALLSNLIGYKSAERVAVTCRRMKRLVAG